MESPEPQLLNALARRLSEVLGGTGIRTPEGESRAALLRAARDVAHASERQNAPLATYLVGGFVAARVAAGADERDAIAEAMRIVENVTDQR